MKNNHWQSFITNLRSLTINYNDIDNNNNIIDNQISKTINNKLQNHC